MYNIAHRTLLYKELLEYVESFGGFKGKLQQARVGFVLPICLYRMPIIILQLLFV